MTWIIHYNLYLLNYATHIKLPNHKTTMPILIAIVYVFVINLQFQQPLQYLYRTSSPKAFSCAVAFCNDSYHSRLGTLSATMPAPTCPQTCAEPD